MHSVAWRLDVVGYYGSIHCALGCIIVVYHIIYHIATSPPLCMTNVPIQTGKKMKLQIGRLVVGWVTTSEYLLLYIFVFFALLVLFLLPL